MSDNKKGGTGLATLVQKGGGLSVGKREALQALGTKYGMDLEAMKRRINGQGGGSIGLAIDATGSMSHCWHSARQSIEKLVTRLNQLHPGRKIRIYAYRDYEDQDLLESSEETSNVSSLIGFLDKIDCHGGGDFPEAVEAALEKILEDGCSVGIIVGDAPQHGIVDKVERADWKEVCRRLKLRNIKVYTIATDNNEETIKGFKGIASQTEGKFFPLDDIDSLIDSISFACAASFGMTGRMADIIRSEQGGKLTKEQECLLLMAE